MMFNKMETHLYRTFALFVTLIIPSVFATGTPRIVEEYYVEPELTLVENWEGWGTSLAWWADMVGGMDPTVQDYVVDAIFNPDKLNFNIVRYVIGGTTPNDVVPYPCGPYRDGAATESFKDGPDMEFNNTRDERQIRILQNSIAKGVNILEAFSNSPPQWMTVSNCTKGNNNRFPLHDNMDPTNAPAFANYVTDVIKYFNDTLGITFEYYAPFNEPYGLEGIGGWYPDVATQEGCNIKRATMVDIIKAVDVALKEKGMDYVTITGADETQINTAVATANYFLREGVASLLSKWNVHGYWDVPTVPNNRRDLLNIISYKGGQKLWMDEMGWGSTPLDNMGQGMEISNRILSDLRNMMPSAWLYWQVVESIGQWGVISVPYKFDAKLEEVEYNSGYYAMMQFSKYIKQGYKLIFINDPMSVTAFHNETGTLVLVTVHEPDTTLTKVFDLKMFSGNLFISSVTRTSSSEQHANIPNGATLLNGKLELPIAPTSVTTVVILRAHYADLGNRREFSDFDSADTDSTWGVTEDGSAFAEEFPWRGIGHAYLPASADFWHENALIRSFGNVDFPFGRIYVTVHASTVGADTSLEIWKDEKMLARTLLNPRPGYRMYGISAPVGQLGNVTIKVRSSSGHGPVYVDNVMVCYREEYYEGGSSNASNVTFSMKLLVLVIMQIFFRST